MSTETQRIEEILSTLKKRQETNRLNYYQPYRFQLDFHEAGKQANQRLLMAANRVGKSFVGAMEMSMLKIRILHATERSPPRPWDGSVSVRGGV